MRLPAPPPSTRARRRHRPARHWLRAPAFSLTELALVAALLAALLALTSGIYRHGLTRARVVDTQALLARLRDATTALGDGDKPAASKAASAAAVVGRLCRTEAGDELRRETSRHMLRCPPGEIRCADAWGTPIRFIPPGTRNAAWQRRVQLAAGQSIFESAGPDRDFGDRNPTRQMDDLRSDEPDLPNRELVP